METENTEATSNRRRNDIEKSTWKTHQYFVDFENQVHVEIPTSNRYHNFHMVSPFKIDEISTNFPRGISTSNRWRIDEDVSIELGIVSSRPFFCMLHMTCLLKCLYSKKSILPEKIPGCVPINSMLAFDPNFHTNVWFLANLPIYRKLNYDNISHVFYMIYKIVCTYKYLH